MNTAKVILGEVERKCCAVMRPQFAESIGQARKAFAPLAERPVLSLNMRRADPFLIGSAVNRLLGDLDDFSWGGAPLTFDGLGEFF